MLGFDNYRSTLVRNGTKRTKLTLVRGMPGSGKSTLGRHLEYEYMEASEYAIHLETDMYFSRFGSYDWNRDELRRAHEWCLTTTQILLAHSNHVVVSNTFTTFKEIAPYVDFAAKQGHALQVISMTNEYGSIHNVPEDTMASMLNRILSHSDMIEKINEYLQVHCPA